MTDVQLGARGLALRQTLVVALLFAGYAAYYFCRSDFSVAMPMLADELHLHGMPVDTATVHLGSIASLGVLAYACGKVFLGGLGDLWGGRRSFLGGMAGAIVFTVLFTAGGGLPLFTLAWIGNRLTQSIGWAGLVKVCSKWFNYTSYGRVAGILSLSFLIGDAAARQSMGLLIARGHGWRFLFYFAAGVCGCIFLANLFLLRESRAEIGFPEPVVNPLNVFQSENSLSGSNNFQTILLPLLVNRGFWIVCFLSLGTTIVRETFNTWTPTYLHAIVGYSDASAAGMSSVFPAVGAISVIVAAWAGDRLGANGRSIVLFAGLAAATAGLFGLTLISTHAGSLLPVVFIGIVAFGLLGPYSYLAGALALDFGGKRGGATSSGIIDGIGYFGGVLAGDGVARLSIAAGWNGVFSALAAVSAVSMIASALLYLYQQRQMFFQLPHEVHRA